MKSLKFGIIALFLGTMGFINTSFATDNPQQGPMMKECPMMQETMQNCAQYKKLTADQKTKVDKIMQDFKGKVMPLKDQMQAKHDELEKQLAMTTPDESKVNSLTKEISDLRNQMFTTHVQARLEMAKIGFSAGECWKSMHPMMKKGMKHGSMTQTPAVQNTQK